MQYFKYNFLFEITSQEIPAKMQKNASIQLALNFLKNAKNFLIFISPKYECQENKPAQQIFEKILNKYLEDLEDLNLKIYFSSSRISFEAELIIFQVSQEKIIKGPQKKNEDKNEDTDISLKKFLEKNNASEADIKIISEKNSEYYAISKKIEMNFDETKIIQNLEKICYAALKEFKWPNSLVYEGSNGHSWIRPITNILSIIESNNNIKKIDFEFAGIKSSSYSLGHRILSGKNEIDFKPVNIALEKISDYEDSLRKNFVMISEKERFLHIINSAIKKSKEFSNYIENLDHNRLECKKIFKASASHIENLISELTCIADWPNILVCDIPEEFLSLPRELIEYVMISHQRYIPLINSNDNLLGKFLVVIDHEKDSIEMKNGYEKVLIARLLDAKFFFERFLNSDINEIFDKKLKQKESEFSELSIFDLNSKIFDLAEKIILKNNKNIKLERNMLDASRIDLCFELISEYPALRGIMSSYFWKNFDKSSFSSFFAIDENIVEEKRNQIYSISKNIYFNAGEVYKRDILDSDAFEARFFGICEKIIRLQYFFFEKNQNPTASKDPFALKRDLYNLFQFISQDSIDFENSKIKNSLFDFDIFDIIFDYEKKTNEQKDNLLNFIYKNLEQFIYSQIEFIEASIQKDFLRKIVNFVVSDLYQNQKILSFMNSEKLNILRIFEVILYLLKLKEEVNISFKDAFKRISQMYSKKYKNFQINLNEVEFAFDLNEEIELNEFCKKISNDLDNIEDSKDYIEKLLKYSDNIPSLINSFLDNVFIEDSDEGKKYRRIFLLRRIFEIIQKKFDFDKFFELF